MRLIVLASALSFATGCNIIFNIQEGTLGSAGGGGSGASSQGGTPTTGGGGEGTGGQATGGGGMTEGGGGSGGSPAVNITCSLQGDPFDVEDLSAEPTGSRVYRDRSFAYMPNGDTVRVFVEVNGEIRVRDVNVNLQTINGTDTIVAQEFMDAARLDASHVGVLVARSFVNPTGFPIDVVSYGNQIDNPTVMHISDGALSAPGTNPPRGKMLFVGPATERIDLLVRAENGGTYEGRYAVHQPGVLTTTYTTLLNAQGNPDLGDQEAATPRAIVRDGQGRVHAFVGSPTMAGMGGTQQWYFAPGDATAQSPNLIGPGYLMIGANRRDTGDVNLAFGVIGQTTLELAAAQIPDTQLQSVSPSDLETILDIGSLLDVPSSGEPRLADDALVFAGPAQTKDRMVLIVGRTEGGTAYYEKNFFAPTAGLKFGDLTTFATNSPITTLGGLGYIVYSERTGSGTTAYDTMRIQQVACGPE